MKTYIKPKIEKLEFEELATITIPIASEGMRPEDSDAKENNLWDDEEIDTLDSTWDI